MKNLQKTLNHGLKLKNGYRVNKRNQTTSLQVYTEILKSED